jgi:hypothetical protein
VGQVCLPIQVLRSGVPSSATGRYVTAMSSMQSDRTAPQRSSAIFENFRTFPAFKATEIKSRLEPRQRSFREPKPKPEIATALSSTGWLATASQSSIRLFRLEGINQTRDIRRVALIECSPEYGKVRAIAISEDILAVITYSHLLLYEYKQIVNNAVSCVDVRQIDQNQAWTPKSVAIRQRGIVGVGLDADAWLAIGGEGKIGVKLFRYSYKTCWNAQSDRINLTCARNTSSMRLVSFSPDFPYTGDQIIVVGATESNKIYCWGVGHGSGRRALEPSWILNCDRRTDGVVSTAVRASREMLIGASHIEERLRQPQSSYLHREDHICSAQSIKSGAPESFGASQPISILLSGTKEPLSADGVNYQRRQLDGTHFVGLSPPMGTT